MHMQFRARIFHPLFQTACEISDSPSPAKKPLFLLRHSLKCYFKPQWNQWKDSKWLSQPLDEALIRLCSLQCFGLEAIV